MFALFYDWSLFLTLQLDDSILLGKKWVCDSKDTEHQCGAKWWQSSTRYPASVTLSPTSCYWFVLELGSPLCRFNMVPLNKVISSHLSRYKRQKWNEEGGGGGKGKRDW